ncbi:hypothetical protein BC829DRAFT_449854 [Chytridium lagenaria]|nr:hypothetical protein BC829DRAFT_449854 [Chytridium lagenaria]
MSEHHHHHHLTESNLALLDLFDTSAKSNDDPKLAFVLGLRQPAKFMSGRQCTAFGYVNELDRDERHEEEGSTISLLLRPKEQPAPTRPGSGKSDPESQKKRKISTMLENYDIFNRKKLRDTGPPQTLAPKNDGPSNIITTMEEAIESFSDHGKENKKQGQNAKKKKATAKGSTKTAIKKDGNEEKNSEEETFQKDQVTMSNPRGIFNLGKKSRKVIEDEVLPEDEEEEGFERRMPKMKRQRVQKIEVSASSAPVNDFLQKSSNETSTVNVFGKAGQN